MDQASGSSETAEAKDVLMELAERIDGLMEHARMTDRAMDAVEQKIGRHLNDHARPPEPVEAGVELPDEVEGLPARLRSDDRNERLAAWRQLIFNARATISATSEPSYLLTEVVDDAARAIASQAAAEERSKWERRVDQATRAAERQFAEVTRLREALEWSPSVMHVMELFEEQALPADQLSGFTRGIQTAVAVLRERSLPTRIREASASTEAN